MCIYICYRGAVRVQSAHHDMHVNVCTCLLEELGEEECDVLLLVAVLPAGAVTRPVLRRRNSATPFYSATFFNLKTTIWRDRLGTVYGVMKTAGTGGGGRFSALGWGASRGGGP